MGTTERRARQRDDLRLKILGAATELFLQNGFESVSMRKIAEKIEYAPSTIYLYFEDKDAICAAIGAEAFEVLLQGLDEREKRNLPPLESARVGLRYYVEFGMEHPNQYRLVFATPTPEGAETPEVNALGMQALEYLARCLARCRAEGLFIPGDDMADSLACWGQLHGLTLILINDHGKYGFPWPSKEAMIDRGIDLILRGLLVTPAP
ncbi:MAG: TetR/AcrR family transcriptional regulator [Bryobacteraceae bacterium]